MAQRRPLGGVMWALLAPAGFAHETERELRHLGLPAVFRDGDFFLFEGEPVEVAWSAVRWLRVEKLPVASIGAGAKALRPLARKWEVLGARRRAALIHEQLRAYRSGEAAFPGTLEAEEGVGAFTLLSDSELAWCREFDRPDPLGRACFLEDRESAPSRAYLKLWEALALRGELPAPGELCFDLGSSPGGWTWVLASLGARVLSIDGAPLDAKIAAMSGVEYRRGDAFVRKPEPCDWLCCDVICAPERLLELVRAWEGMAKRMVCTLKFQGEADPAVVAEFRKLGRVLHLHHNKHELTFLR